MKLFSFSCFYFHTFAIYVFVSFALFMDYCIPEKQKMDSSIKSRQSKSKNTEKRRKEWNEVGRAQKKCGKKMKRRKNDNKNDEITKRKITTKINGGHETWTMKCKREHSELERRSEKAKKKYIEKRAKKIQQIGREKSNKWLEVDVSTKYLKGKRRFIRRFLLSRCVFSIECCVFISRLLFLLLLSLAVSIQTHIPPPHTPYNVEITPAHHIFFFALPKNVEIFEMKIANGKMASLRKMNDVSVSEQSNNNEIYRNTRTMHELSDY